MLIRKERQAKAYAASDFERLAALHWYALQTPPQKEIVAQIILETRGVEAYLPVREEWRRKNKYTKEKQLRQFPEMPRYVFAGFDPGFSSWRHWLHRIPVITGVVGLDGEPRRIVFEGDGLAHMMRAYPNSTYVAPKEQKYMHTHQEFSVGDVVEILDGPLAGRELPVVSIRKSSAIFRLIMLGVEQEIALPLDKMVKSA